MENKRTAIDWLFRQLWDEPQDKFTWYALLQQAKEMEKEQTCQFVSDYVDDGQDMTAEEYYDLTYGGKND